GANRSTSKTVACLTCNPVVGLRLSGGVSSIAILFLPIENDLHRLAAPQEAERFFIVPIRHLMGNQLRHVDLVFEQESLALIPGLVHQPPIDTPNGDAF